MITRTATNGTLPRRPAAAAVTGWPDQYVIWHPSGAGTYADRAGGDLETKSRRSTEPKEAS